MSNFFVILIAAFIIVLLCIAGMAVNIIVKKNGRFPETEISRNKDMKRLGIKCAKQEEIEMLNKTRKRKLHANCGDCTDCELSQKK